MFSWAPLRKSSPSISRALAAYQQLITGRSFSNKSSTEASNNKNVGETFAFPFLRSGLIVVGCSLGLYFWSNSRDNHSVCFADAPEAATTCATDPFQPPKKSKYLFGDAYRRRVFFKYEKRIRMQSPPEKVFEYFASHQTETGDVLMTPADLMRAIVPVFSPSESSRVREGSLRGETAPGELHCAPSEFFMLFDTNNDGLISFPEYIFFVTLLSIPESSFSVAFKMFDLDNNGEIDRDEFKKVMALMRSQNRQIKKHRDGRRGNLRVAEPVENGGLVEYFFGKDGKQCLKHEKFVQFLKELHQEILKLEFAHYDYKLRGEGTILAKDFALSLVASADIRHINKLLDRGDELNNEPSLRNIRITFEEFKNFAELRRKLQSFSLAIFSYGMVNGVLTKKDFQRAASQVCGISISDNVINIIFHVFDANRDGNLSSDEFIRVLQRREKDDRQPWEAGTGGGFLSCWLSCATKCTCASR